MYVNTRPVLSESSLMPTQRLRYKDYQLASRPAQVVTEQEVDSGGLETSSLAETTSVKAFGQIMQQRGVFEWWRKGMGYTANEDKMF